jgi:hypothetical protein
MWSAEQLPEEEQEAPGKLDLWIEKHFAGETAEKIILYTAVVIVIAFAIFLFSSSPPCSPACWHISSPWALAWLGGGNAPSRRFPRLSLAELQTEGN